ncbi:PAS domain-containing sensor histidine kinase, partial [Sedimenticola sp.]|uniref:PAS domain-containing sensor histidine kinase n=1 Tax=Sedimenticola sp. TaxID=1940285 RepID=UPI00258F122B
EEAQRFIESVQAAMTDVLIVCDIQGRIQQANTALERITGRSEKELLNHSFKELFVESSQYLVDGFADKIRSETVYDCEVNLISADGTPTPLAMNCSSRYDHNGRLVGMVLIGRPVGELRRAYEELHETHKELKQAQEQLVHSEKMASLGRLVAGVAHELNNPISFVFGNMHALKRYGERITRYLDVIHKDAEGEEREALRKQLKIDHILSDIGSLIDGTLEGAERVSDIVMDLRRFSGNQQEDIQPFLLAPVVTTAVDWVVKAARRKPDVSVEIPGDLQAVGIKGLVHQILVNLVQNAIDVMEQMEEPRLMIRGWQDWDRVRIEVRDFGPGIPKADLMRVFDPFFTTKDVGKGTGLGLYISYGLANDQGGSLVASNHPAGGAMFTLTLKAA